MILHLALFFSVSYSRCKSIFVKGTLSSCFSSFEAGAPTLSCFEAVTFSPTETLACGIDKVNPFAINDIYCDFCRKREIVSDSLSKFCKRSSTNSFKSRNVTLG
ncbi:hypothetical protein, partial [uncultured Megasphaera sp.]|uniref:hypothetical protein n=1 Tax=uncultured Megasphaera sp. TaxID=165188 RepID=UPI0026042FC7